MEDLPNEKFKIPLSSFLEYWKPFLIWLFVCLILSSWYAYTRPRSYSGEASILLEARRQTAFTSDINSANYPPTLDSAQADSQIQVIKSERLLRFVFDALDLGRSPELLPGPPRLSARIIQALKNLASSENAAGDGMDDAMMASFKQFSNRVSARRIGQSYVIEVSYSSGSPQTAAKLANSISMAYIRQQIAGRAAAAQNGSEYLQGRIVKFEAELKAADDGVLTGTIPTLPFPDADARIISAAIPSTESISNKSIIVAAGLVAGFLLGIFVIFIKVATSGLIRSSDDLRDASGLRNICDASALFVDLLPGKMSSGSLRSNRKRRGASAEAELGLGLFVNSIARADVRCERINLIAFQEIYQCGKAIYFMANFLRQAGFAAVIIDFEQSSDQLTELMEFYSKSQIITTKCEILGEECLIRSNGLNMITVVLPKKFRDSPEVLSSCIDRLSQMFSSRDGLLNIRYILNLGNILASPDLATMLGGLSNILILVNKSDASAAKISRSMKNLEVANVDVAGAILV